LDAGPRNDEALKLSIALAVLMGDAASLSMAERQVAILREVIANPKDADFMHAQVLDKQDRSREAIIAYEALIRDNGTLAKVYLELLPLLERNDMADRAKTWVAYWRNLAPDEILAAQADVRLRCLSGQTADARRVAEQFAAAYVERGKTDVANLRIPPNVDAEKYREAYLQDRLQTADFMMGAAFLKGKAFEDAEAWIQRGLKVKPDAELLQLKLGDIYLAMLQNTSDPMRRTQLAQRAKAEYAKVYTEKKGHSYAGQNLAWLLVKELGDAEEALRIAREVRRGKASNKPISGDRLPLAFLDTLGLIYRNLNKPELFEEMRLLFDDARRTYPTDPRVYLYLGDAYAGLGQTRAADTNYAAAISLSGPRAKTRIPTAELQNILEDANAQRKKLGPRSALK
jgi:hypothetical protein